MIIDADIRHALSPLVYDIKAPGMSAEGTRAALDRAVARIVSLIEDAQASEEKRVYGGCQRISAMRAPGHDINSGGNCRAPGCRWFSDGDRRHNEPGEEPEGYRESIWD